MAINQAVNWILAYDIANPRRLGRVHRAIKKIGIPLQYSLWIIKENGAGIERIKRELLALIDPRADDIRIYRIPADPEIIQLGRSLLAEEIQLIDNGREIRQTSA